MNSPPRYRYLIINLERAHERRDHMRRELKNAGIAEKAEFIAATDGRKLRENLGDRGRVRRMTRRNRYFYRTALSWDETGCFLSHQGMWRRLAADDEHDFYVLLEDEARLSPNLDAIVRSLLAGGGADLVRLHAFQGRPTWIAALRPLDAGARLALDWGPVKNVRILSPSFLRTRRLFYRWFFGTTAYVISRKGAQALLAQNARRLLRPVDEQMQRFWEHGLPPLIVHPMPVWTRDELPSTIARKSPETLVWPRFARWDPRHEIGRVLRFLVRRASLFAYKRARKSWRKKYGPPSEMADGHLPPPWLAQSPAEAHGQDAPAPPPAERAP